nr:hypothetical protein [Tanacetum cinerariifolium]
MLLSINDIWMLNMARQRKKEQHSLLKLPKGPACSVVIRKPDSGRIQPLPDVQGKGKEKVIDEQATHDLLTLLNPKNKSPVDQFIFQMRTPMLTEASGHAESPSLVAELPLIDNEIESDNAGSNPEDTAESQPQSSHVVHAGPNRKHMDLEATDASTRQNPEQMDEEFTTTAYPNVQENLKLPFEDPVIPEEPASSTRTLSSLVGKIRKTRSPLKLVDEPSAEDVSMRTPMLTEASVHAESPSLVAELPLIDNETESDNAGPNPGVQDKGQTGSNPEDTTESQPQSSHVVHAGPNHTSSVPPMTTSVIDLTTSQSGSPLLTSTATTSAVMTTINIPPPPQPQQSITNLILMKRIEHMANLLQYNLALRKDQLLSDLEEARQKKRKRRDIPRTPYGSPPPQPPPPPPLAGASGALGTSKASGSSQFPPPPPPLSTGTFRSAQQQGSEAPSSSKSAASAPQSIDWTTSGTRYESAGLSRSQDKGSSTALSISKMKAASYLDFGLELLMLEQMWIDDVYMLLRRVEKNSDQPCGFSVSSELKHTPDTGYEFKHEYTIIESPRAVVFSVNNNERKIMWFNEIYKFSDGTLTRILEALAYRVKEFKIRQLNPENCTKRQTMYLLYQSYKDGK